LKESRKVSSIERYWGVVRNGLFFFGLMNRLNKIGIEIRPYYWVQEEVEPCMEPVVKDGASNYTMKKIGIDESKSLRCLESDKQFDELIKGIEKGQLCFGLVNNGKIAAYTFVELNNFEFKGKKIKLKPNEAYLLNMWTFHEYRGRNLAPYLRFQTYKMLLEEGRDVKYSITEYFNKSSGKFKKKLNSKNLSLHLNIELFGKFKWHFKIKDYE
jgi:hypothetical protein